MCMLKDFLLENKELIAMGSQIAVAIAVIFSGIALWISAKAIKLQQDSVNTSLFLNFYNRINDILEKEKEYKSDRRLSEWCITLLSHFEYLAFMANRNLISFELVELYKEMIITWYDKVLIEQKDDLSDYNLDHQDTFSELKKLYKKIKTE